MADRFGYGEIGLDINPCRGCEDYDALDGCKSNGGCGKPITNAERIMAMSDEELAKFESTLGCHPDARRETCLGVNRCAECWLDWLKQEAE